MFSAAVAERLTIDTRVTSQIYLARLESTQGPSGQPKTDMGRILGA